MGKSQGFRRKTPSVLQMEAVECGAASLAMILAYHGRWVPLEDLRVACGVSRDGSKASNIAKAARIYGLEARGFRTSVEDMLKMDMPAIVFWNFNHFLVVEGWKGATVFLNDPAMGPRTVNLREFKEGFSDIALTFKPGDGFEAGGKPPSTYEILRNRLRGSEDVIGQVFLAGLLVVMPSLVMTGVLKAFIDDVLIRGNTGWLLPLLVALLLAAGLSGLLTWLQRHLLLRVQAKLAISVSGQLIWHVFRLPLGFFAQRYVGDVASRVYAGTRIASLMSESLSSSLISLVMVGLYLLVMFFTSWPLALLSLFLASANVIVVVLVQDKRRDMNMHMMNQSAKAMGAAVGGLQAIETLKASGTEGDFFAKWAGYHTKTINAQQELGLYSFLLDAMPELLRGIINALVLILGALLIIKGHLTMGGLIAFQILLNLFLTPIQTMVGFSAQVQEIQGDLARIEDVFKYELDSAWVADKGQGGTPSGSMEHLLSGAVELSDITFAYGPLDPPLIENFTMSVEPGSRIALVGGSGSGKSTLSKLILGLYQPRSGEVLFDGQPINFISRAVFTRSVAYVDQDIRLFRGTIRENITMWDEHIPMEKVLQAAMDACIHEVIAARPGGYESLVDEGGANFSGGQRQRLEIARALVRDPALIVLDEATAALDPLTEQIIDQNLRRRGCACIIVAHRLSTIRDADEIIVLDRGMVQERGNHAQLMQHNGRYAQLVAMI
jgi:NHLM bacteriocin system ABC transporter peptidase/ATP-binding protein